jgi:hypothetical protein
MRTIALLALCLALPARRTPRWRVEGALLFDGGRFCQWLHGSGEVASRLLTTIALDRRHVDFKLLHLGVSDVTPAISGWCSGFAPPFALDVLDSNGMGSDEVLPMFLNVLAEADV